MISAMAGRWECDSGGRSAVQAVFSHALLMVMLNGHVMAMLNTLL